MCSIDDGVHDLYLRLLYLEELRRKIINLRNISSRRV